MTMIMTSKLTSQSNLLWGVTSAVGAGLCFLVLLAIVAVWWHPISRPSLDRVSFRVVTLALVANMIFGIASAVGGMMTHDGFLCGFSVFVLQLTLQISSFLLLCVALNLQFVVVHGFNGRNLERFYIIFSLGMSAVLAIPPYAANQYGWDPLEGDCWYKNDNVAQRLAWRISTQMLWTTLSALAEIAISVFVLLSLLRHRTRMNRVFVRSSSSSSPQVIHSSSFRLRLIILRIALYPIASCFVNLLTVFTALHSTVSDGIHNKTDYRILLLSDFLYGGRPIVYALLAASDPALVRGLKTLYRVNRGIYGPYPDHIEEHSTDSDESRRSRGLIVHIELSTIRDTEPSTHISKLPGAPTVIKADTKDKDPGVEVTENLNTALPQNTEGEVTRVEGAGSRSRTRGRNYRESLGSSASGVGMRSEEEVALREMDNLNRQI